jgi:hypothetical protein
MKKGDQESRNCGRPPEIKKARKKILPKSLQ